MSKTSSLVLSLLFVVMMDMSVHGDTSKTVKISVYYESLCPDSIAFVRNQLWPTYESLKDIMNVDLVPYGKATHKKDSDGSYSFSCQHGPNECKGNKVQACAIKLYPKESSIAFVKCAMSRRRPEQSGEVCARQLNLDVVQLQNCSNTSQGDEHLASFGDRTHSLEPKLNFVPWININDQHDSEQQWEALSNLKRVICSAYNSTDNPSSGCP